MQHPGEKSSKSPTMILPLWLPIWIFQVWAGLTLQESSCFFSFKHRDRTYPCALIHWFSKIGEEPDVNTGMWSVEPNFDAKGKPLHAVIL